MYLGLDLGTTNVKALAVDRRGHVCAEGAVGVQWYCTPGGSVEQDIEEIWTATLQAIRQAASALQEPIQAVGVSSQGGALQLLAQRGEPLGRVISWMDGRGRPFDEQLAAELGEAFFAEHIGRCQPVITPGQILRLRAESPNLLQAAKQIGYVGDVIVGRLCGRRAHDATSLSIAMLLNPSLGQADSDLLRRLALRPEQLPDLISATDPAGPLCGEVAEQTGLPAGIPVSAAIHDQYAASIGAGSVAPGDVCIGTGTAWVLVANTPRLARPATRATFVCPHPVAGLFGQMLSMTNGGSALDWALRLLGREKDSGDQIDDALLRVLPGCDGLSFWPLLSPGSTAEGAWAGGGRMAGISLAHGPDHLLRAVVEGLACELKRHLEILTAAGLPVTRLVLTGGAASSRVTPQILADLTERAVACVRQSAVSAFGAAVIARALAEQRADLAALARDWAPTTRMIEPQGDLTAYRQLWGRYIEPFA